MADAKYDLLKMDRLALITLLERVTTEHAAMRQRCADLGEANAKLSLSARELELQRDGLMSELASARAEIAGLREQQSGCHEAAAEHQPTASLPMEHQPTASLPMEACSKQPLTVLPSRWRSLDRSLNAPSRQRRHLWRNTMRGAKRSRCRRRCFDRRHGRKACE